MKGDIVETVTGWDSEPFAGGYAGLAALAEEGFTGALSEGSAWAFAVNGRFVGVFDGTIEAFEGADGTAYAAPHPSLPLLYAMRLRGGETKGKYYTNDTPLSEVDETLSAGNFTGYVELSENVLSGEYYVVYHGGTSMSVAFVGNNGTCVTGDEAFERADGEVGIYEVTAVDLDLVELPEPASTDATEGDGSAERAIDRGAEAGGVERGETDVGGDDEPGDRDAASRSETDETEGDGRDERAAVESEAATETAVDDPGGSIADAGRPTDADGGSDDSAEVESTEVESADTSERSSETTDDDDVFSEEAQWRNAKSIPSLDPERSGSVASGGGRPGGAERTAGGGQRANRSARKPPRRPNAEDPRREPVAKAGEAGGAGVVQRLERRLDAVTRERDEAAAKAERLAVERGELAAERDRLREERERLRSRVEELEAERERLEDALDDAGSGTDSRAAGRTMTERSALDGTNLFVRYGTKSEGTLEKAHGGEATREEVNENLRVEHHTGFDADGVSVGGEPFEEFLAETVEYGFVRWVVEDLLYEIRETGNEGVLDGLFDAIPKIDRAELGGSVSLRYSEGGEERREQRSFDVVLRDRMGNPLLVADLNDSREPATERMMTDLIENASKLCESASSLGGAFLVTASYFEPEALETTADATGGGLLGRGRRKSFVKLSRKRGFHLCLVETRGGDFHVSVPEL
ncbi:DUF7527 domain-containing protein [Halegenticoccus tardaugens]|uniref:DUF7527 domain-containing protein n=1 Tax=Halegenticoccus tardaugens TaxID=2071624 RepID=UPI00100A595F|nr:hypothetical protein [Halegenticoccus tardaugens]